jgi:hypothetical protein
MIGPNWAWQLRRKRDSFGSLRPSLTLLCLAAAWSFRPGALVRMRYNRFTNAANFSAARFIHTPHRGCVAGVRLNRNAGALNERSSERKFRSPGLLNLLHRTKGLSCLQNLRS